IFSVWSLLMWFNSELQVVYRAIELYGDDLVVVKTAYSATFSIICYCILVISFYFLFQYIRNIRHDLYKPTMWVLFFASFTVAAEIIKFIVPAWSSWLLSISVYCGFVGMIMLVILLRFKFFSIVPFARNM